VLVPLLRGHSPEVPNRDTGRSPPENCLDEGGRSPSHCSTVARHHDHHTTQINCWPCIETLCRRFEAETSGSRRVRLRAFCVAFDCTLWYNRKAPALSTRGCQKTVLLTSLRGHATSVVPLASLVGPSGRSLRRPPSSRARGLSVLPVPAGSLGELGFCLVFEGVIERLPHQRAG